MDDRYEKTLANLAWQLKLGGAMKSPVLDVGAWRANAAHLDATADHLDKAADILRGLEELRWLEAIAEGRIRTPDDPLPEELDSDQYATTARRLRETAAHIRTHVNHLKRKKFRPELLTAELFIRIRKASGKPISLYEAGDAVLDLQSVFAQAGKPISTETAKGYLREVIRMRRA